MTTQGRQGFEINISDVRFVKFNYQTPDGDLITEIRDLTGLNEREIDDEFAEWLQSKVNAWWEEADEDEVRQMLGRKRE